MGRMRRSLLIATMLIGCMFAEPVGIHGREDMRMQVSPAVSSEPAFVTVRVMIEVPADSRFLEVIAESPEFYRSSRIPIDGVNASFLKVFEFANLPSGTYDVTGVLLGPDGPRASISRIARVV